MRNLGPNGTPNFCKRSSLKYGNSIMPTLSASNKLAYFYFGREKKRMEKELKN